MDPQQCLVLLVGYAALAGGCLAMLQNRSGSRDSGVFVGVEASGVMLGQLSVFSASGGALSITSGRFSYTLGLVGPCYSIDTACSSALAALHVGFGTIALRECGKGVGIAAKVLSEAMNHVTSIGGMLSERGRCHTFD